MKNEVLFDALGRMVGRMTCHRIVTKKERQWAASFVERVTKQRKGEEEMVRTTPKEDSSTKERTNMAFLAGIVKTVKLEDDRAFFTLDVGLKQWVPCSTYKNDEVLQKLRGLNDGDFIQLKAFIKPWSQKAPDGENWNRGINIEVTEVKKIIKGSGNGARSSVASRFKATGDDIPF